MKQKHKIQWKATPADYNKQKTESQGRNIKMNLGKNEELFIKQLKICERNVQELITTIKIPNVRIMGIKEEEV
jgi:hypothetical protein